MLKGHTWDIKNGTFGGLMQGKKALTIVSSGGSFSTPQMKSLEHSMSLSTAEFQFMGFSEVKGIFAEAMSDEDAKLHNLTKAFDEADKISREWYN